MHRIIGKVIRGDGYGRKLGYPTMNLETKDKLPPQGVYAGTAEIGGKKYRAGILIGLLDKTEAHLIGYEGNAYGKEVSLEINKFLREYKHFDSEEELIKQIEKDMAQC